MTDPFVCCITLTRDRPEYVARAIACYRSQAYAHKGLVILNSGTRIGYLSPENDVLEYGVNENDPLRGHYSIGWLRNKAIELITRLRNNIDLIAHFDDDDWSAPGRLAEQVAFMQESGAGVVGYREIPLYVEDGNRVLLYSNENTHYAVGTSLMYKREVWERVPFPDETPEDTTWQHKVGAGNIASVSALRADGPMIIQTVHGANAAAGRNLGASVFRRASAELEAKVRVILCNANAGTAR